MYQYKPLLFWEAVAEWLASECSDSDHLSQRFKSHSGQGDKSLCYRWLRGSMGQANSLSMQLDSHNKASILNKIRPSYLRPGVVNHTQSREPTGAMGCI